MRPYPNFRNSTNLEELKDRLAVVNDTREEDIAQYNLLVSRVGTIRKVVRVPSGSTDVLATDRLGDFNWDASYFYYLTESSGSLAWRRIASASW